VKVSELNPGITVIIVTYRRPELVNKVLAQLINQTELPVRIIVVDNDLHRSAESVINRFNLETKIVPVIYVANHENSLTVGRNIGVSHSRTKFTCLLDDDVVIPEDYLLRSLTIIEKLPDAAGIQGMLNLEDRNSFKNFVSFLTGNFFLTSRPPRARWSISASYPTHEASQAPLPTQWMSGTNQFYRTEIIKEIKWDENLIKYCDGEDLDHSLRVSQSGFGSLYIIPNLTVEHLETPEARVIGFKNILMREVYSYYLLHKLFPGNQNAKIFYLWSRISTLHIRIIQVGFSKFSEESIQVLKNYLKALDLVIKNRKDIRKGNLGHINALL
jgi:GT2 family glycosyltransferase